MKRPRNSFTTGNPFLIWGELAMKSAEMLTASAHVISHRTNRMMMSGPIPNATDRKEFHLMGQEKLEAAAESAQAMAMRMITMNQQIGTAAFKQMMNGASGMMSMAAGGTLLESAALQKKLLEQAIGGSSSLSSQMARSTAQVMQRGLRPIHSRATANSKRLGKLR